MTNTSSIPEGHQAVMPYLIIKNATRAIDFYISVFGARESCRFTTPIGKIAHAELQIGASRLMIHDEFTRIGMLSPQTLGGTPLWVMIYVEDVDAIFAKAMAEGAKCLMPVHDSFYGDRCARIEDPFGHRWVIATHVKAMSEDQLKAAAHARLGMEMSVPAGAEA